jgi:uncharacterized protein YbaR (Trm112 family)
MSAPSSAGATALSPESLGRLACPACHGSLVLDAQTVLCQQCRRRYPIQDAIPVLITDRAVQSE